MTNMTSISKPACSLPVLPTDEHVYVAPKLPGSIGIRVKPSQKLTWNPKSADPSGGAL